MRHGPAKRIGRGRSTGGMAVALHSHSRAHERPAASERGTLVRSHKRSTRQAPAVVLGLALGLLGLVVGGCSSGGPHSRMSPTEIEERMGDEFPLGTARDEVLAQLQRRGATYDAPLPLEQPLGWSSLRVYFDQPWWGPLTWASTYRKTEAWADLLFDQGQSLRQIVGEVRERQW